MCKHHAHIMFFSLLQCTWISLAAGLLLLVWKNLEPFEVKTWVCQGCLSKFFQTGSYRPAARISPEFSECLLQFISICDKNLTSFLCNAIYSFNFFFHKYAIIRLWKRSYSCKYNFGQKNVRIGLLLHCKRKLSSQY